MLPRHSPALLFLMRVRDEAHRFGITRHRRLRGKSTLASELDGLRGIGASRKKFLLKTFGSVKRLREATEEELRRLPGIGPALADAIHRQLHRDDAA